jgi:hypothetical protein
MAATGWLAHSVRGFVSNLVRKDGHKIEAIKRESGDRAYFLAPACSLSCQPGKAKRRPATGGGGRCAPEFRVVVLLDPDCLI